MTETEKATGGTHGGRPGKLGTDRVPSSDAPPRLADYGITEKATGGQPYQATGTALAPVAPTLADYGIAKKSTGGDRAGRKSQLGGGRD